MTNPLSIHSHGRATVIEQMMTLVGRSSPEPLKFRQWLESLDESTLSAEYAKVMGECLGTDSDVCQVCKGPMVSHGVVGYTSSNQEMEADWMECERCGHCES